MTDTRDEVERIRAQRAADDAAPPDSGRTLVPITTVDPLLARIATLETERDALAARLPSPAAVRAARTKAAEVIAAYDPRTLHAARLARALRDVAYRSTVGMESERPDPATLLAIALRVEWCVPAELATLLTELATDQVIANVLADIPPERQAGALRDLMVGADGEPQLDEDMLEDAAEEADEDAREAAAGEGLVYLRKIADESLVLSGTWDATASRHFRTCAPFVIALVEAVSSEIMIDAYRKRDQHRRERKGCDCDWCNVANAHERLFFFVETAMAENAKNGATR